MYRYPTVRPVMVDDDPVARRAVAIVVEQGVSSFEALRIAELEAETLAYSILMDGN